MTITSNCLGGLSERYGVLDGADAAGDDRIEIRVCRCDDDADKCRVGR